MKGNSDIVAKHHNDGKAVYFRSHSACCETRTPISASFLPRKKVVLPPFLLMMRFDRKEDKEGFEEDPSFLVKIGP
eukprot:scaffold21700_cov164-Amphora_coffeaeformis.AAC.10